MEGRIWWVKVGQSGVTSHVSGERSQEYASGRVPA